MPDFVSSGAYSLRLDVSSALELIEADTVTTKFPKTKEVPSIVGGTRSCEIVSPSLGHYTPHTGFFPSLAMIQAVKALRPQ